LLILAGLWVSTAPGQDPTNKAPAKPTQGAAQPVKRVVYDVKHGVAKDLAELLAKLFKNDAAIQVLAAPAGNALVVSAPPAAVDDIVSLLQRLDRRPRSVVMEVLIAEVRSGAAGKPAQLPKELNEHELTGNSGTVVGKLEALQKKGLLGELKRFTVTASENQTGSVKVLGSKPYTVGIVQTGGGASRRTVMYRDLGTIVKATPQIGDDQRIVLTLHLSDSSMRVPDDAPILGMDENGIVVRATTFVNAQFDGAITVRSGEAAVAKGVTTQGQAGGKQTLVIVTARVEDPAAKAGK